MADRCDTETYWFVFASCGRPYAAIEAGPWTNHIVKEFQREGRRRGVQLDLRSGNFAAATLDELRKAWPGSKMYVDSGIISVDPHDLQLA